MFFLSVCLLFRSICKYVCVFVWFLGRFLVYLGSLKLVPFCKASQAIPIACFCVEMLPKTLKRKKKLESFPLQ